MDTILYLSMTLESFLLILTLNLITCLANQKLLTLYTALMSKMARLTVTILQQTLQNCYCACDHFLTSGTKGLKP